MAEVYRFAQQGPEVVSKSEKMDDIQEAIESLQEGDCMTIGRSDLELKIGSIYVFSREIITILRTGNRFRIVKKFLLTNETDVKVTDRSGSKFSVDVRTKDILPPGELLLEFSTKESKAICKLNIPDLQGNEKRKERKGGYVEEQQPTEIIPDGKTKESPIVAELVDGIFRVGNQIIASVYGRKKLFLLNHLMGI